MPKTGEIEQNKLDLIHEAQGMVEQLASLAAGTARPDAPEHFAEDLGTLARALMATTLFLASERPERSETSDLSEEMWALWQETETRRARHLPEGLGDIDLLARALWLNTHLLLALSSSGECRREVPYASMRPVIRADGTRVWCCNHDTEHCAS